MTGTTKRYDLLHSGADRIFFFGKKVQRTEHFIKRRARVSYSSRILLAEVGGGCACQMRYNELELISP